MSVINREIVQYPLNESAGKGRSMEGRICERNYREHVKTQISVAVSCLVPPEL